MKGENETKSRLSLSTTILIGLDLGIACGIFFGEYCGFLSIIGNAL
jgi:Na+/H+-dicarboxylate symporter